MTPQTHLHNSGIPDNEVAWFPRIFLEDSAPDASDHGPDANDCKGAREGGEVIPGPICSQSQDRG